MLTNYEGLYPAIVLWQEHVYVAYDPTHKTKFGRYTSHELIEALTVD